MPSVGDQPVSIAQELASGQLVGLAPRLQPPRLDPKVQVGSVSWRGSKPVLAAKASPT